MMKKFLAIILTLTLALSLSVTAFAADKTIGPDKNGDPYPSTADTTVQFNVDPTYTVTIPAEVRLARGTDTGTGAVIYKQEAKITASAGMHLLKGQTIQVTLSAGDGETEFVLTSKESAKLPYTVKADGVEIGNNGVVAAFCTDSDEQTATLHFAAYEPEFAGQYSDTVVFTVAIKNE